jgi:hypothetical protein
MSIEQTTAENPKPKTYVKLRVDHIDKVVQVAKKPAVKVELVTRRYGTQHAATHKYRLFIRRYFVGEQFRRGEKRKIIQTEENTILNASCPFARDADDPEYIEMLTQFSTVCEILQEALDTVLAEKPKGVPLTEEEVSEFKEKMGLDETPDTTTETSTDQDAEGQRDADESGVPAGSD